MLPLRQLQRHLPLLRREPYVFPRKSMRYLQLGLESRLQGNLEPWLCYYCGECSDECPREAEPGETMMSMRRWLTARYDFTGISGLFYRSPEGGAAGHRPGGAADRAWGSPSSDCPRAVWTSTTDPGAFLPAAKVHVFDWIMAGVLVVLLGINCVRMWWFTLGGADKEVRVPPGEYLKQLFLVPLHFFTQKRYSQCDRKRPWAVHLVLMLSYLTMLILIMFFLHRMQHGPADRLGGPRASATRPPLGLVVTTIYALVGRVRRTETHYKHSHETDWIFLILLLVVALTGIAQHLLHRGGLAGGRQHRLHGPHDGRGAHAGAGGAVQQMVPHGLPAAGHVLLDPAREGAAGGRGIRGRRARHRPPRPPEEGAMNETNAASASTSATAGPTSPRWSTPTWSGTAWPTFPGWPAPAPTSTCAPIPGQEMITQDIRENGLDRVVVAACSPRMHEPTFRKALEAAGLNPYMLEMANIREQCSWVHDDPAKATAKACRPDPRRHPPGGATTSPWRNRRPPTRRPPWCWAAASPGLTVAVELAEAGQQVYLVEQEAELGGNVGRVGPDRALPGFGPGHPGRERSPRPRPARGSRCSCVRP